MAAHFSDVFSRFSARGSRKAPRGRRQRPVLATAPGETLESRSMLAVTAVLNAGVLEITLSDENDIASLVWDGSTYDPTNSTGYTGDPSFAATAVTAIKVSDIGTGKSGQKFELTGSAAGLDPLTVVGGTELVETVSLNTNITATGAIDVTTVDFSAALVSLTATGITVTATTISAGDLEATASDVTLDATGRIDVAGDVNALEGEISLAAGTKLQIDGNTKAKFDITLTGKDSVRTVGTIESTDGGTVSLSTDNASGEVWVLAGVESAGVVNLGDANTATVKIGNAGPIVVDGGDITVQADQIQFASAATLMAAPGVTGIVKLLGTATAGSTLMLKGDGGVSTSGTLTLTAGNLEVTATNSDVSLGDDVSVTGGEVKIEALNGTLLSHKNITANNNLTIETSATFTATPAQTFKSLAGLISIDAGTGAINLDDLVIDAATAVDLNGNAGIASDGAITAGGLVTITSTNNVQTAAITANSGVTITGGGTGITATGLTKAANGDVIVKATAGDVVMAATEATTGDVELEATLGSVTADQTTASGSITFSALLDINTTGPLTSTTGDIVLKGIAAAARNITIIDDITATAGDVGLYAGLTNTLTLNDGITIFGDKITASGQQLVLPGSATIEATAGEVSIPGTVAAFGTLSLSGPSMKVNGVMLSSGNLAVTATAGDIELTGDVTAAGSIALTAAGTLVDHKNLTAGTNLTITVVDFKAQARFQFLAGSPSVPGNLTIQTTNGDLDVSLLAGTPSVPAGAAASGTATLSADNGVLTVFTVGAGSDITLAATGVAPTGLVVILGGLVSLGGDINITSGSADIVIEDNAILQSQAAGGTITLTAGNNVSGLDVAGPTISSEIKAQIIADSFSVLATGLVSPDEILFTNVNNKVSTLSIKLQDASSVPNGSGIEFVNDLSLTVSDAVTKTGTVKISSLNGALTINGKIGDGTGVLVSGVTLTGKSDVTIAATSGINVGAAGDASIKSTAGAVSANAPISLVNGDLTIDANQALAVAAAAALEVGGAGKNIDLKSGLAMTVSGNVTSNQGSVTIDAQGGTAGLTVTSKVYADDAITITAKNGASITGAGGSPALKTLTGPISVTSTAGAITVAGDVLAADGSVTVGSNVDDVTVSGSITANGTTSDIAVTAGDDLTVTGNLTAGVDITLSGKDVVKVGNGTANTLTATLGSIDIESLNGDVTLNSVATAQNGSIIAAASGVLTINSGSSLTADTIYDPAAVPPTGLIRLVGTQNLVYSSNMPLKAGRLEITSGGVTDITMTNSTNKIGSVAVQTGGKFKFFNSAFLQITDFDPTSPTVQVEATDVDIESALGLRVVDGIVYLPRNLTLRTPVPGGVQFVTTSKLDAAGAFSGSLRNMITLANDNRAATANNGQNPDRTTIAQEMSLLFQSDEVGAPVNSGTITLLSQLPIIARPVILDGTLESGADVQIDGTGVAGDGLRLGAGSSLSIVRDATFTKFASGAGIALASARNHVLDSRSFANLYGVDLSGSGANRNVIGRALNTDFGNVFDNNEVGIRVRSGAAYNEIYGNLVETNTVDGIVVEASIGTAIGKTADAIFANDIKDNTKNGIRITNVFSTALPYGASVVNNWIRNSGAAGVLIEGGGRNQVGSEAVNGRNLIEDNNVGVLLRSSPAGATQGNFIVGNEIKTSTTDGIQVSAGFGNMLNANTISGSELYGVRIVNAATARNRPANQVIRNTIFGNGTGVGADKGGILLDGSSGQVIGGLAANVGNLIDGNSGSGVVVTSVSSAVGAANLIAGNTIKDSTEDGVRIRTSIGNTVQANVLNGNAQNGIHVVGATASTPALGNRLIANDISASTLAGVRIAGGARTTIGGTLAGQGNKVYGNAEDGIVITKNGASLPVGHVVQGNRIGVDGANTKYGVSIDSATDTTVNFGNVIQDNGSGGVQVQGGARNTIGSSLAGRGNQILGNTGNGISVTQPGTGTTQAVTITGNLIQGNTAYAIEVNGANTSGITIGRTPSVSFPNGSENTIRTNALGGVRVEAARQVTIVGNEFSGNGNGVADDIKLASGANGGVNAPTISSATPRLVGMANPQYDVRGTVTGTPGQRFYVDLYGIRNDGRMFSLGRVLVAVGAGGNGSFRAIVGPSRQQLGTGGGINSIVATSTTAVTFGGGTSQFSAEFPL